VNAPADQLETRSVTCRCQHCKGEIDFDADYFDKVKTRTWECHYCHRKTTLNSVFPARLIKCPFDSKQQRFWLETSEWFRAQPRYNESVKFDTDFNKPQPLYEALIKTVPKKFQCAVRDVGHSVFQAFQIIQNKDLGADTKSFPKGASDEGIYNHWEQRKKGLALFLLKHGSALWNPRVYPGIEQAIKENDIEFFRRDIPETLNDRRKIVCFNPDEPERGILSHWLISFWCPGDFWPAWADPNLPPLCLFTDEAAADFLSGVFHPVETTFHAVRKCRKKLGLKKIKETAESKHIHKVICKDGCFLFLP
jgi:hypothetical protein